MNRPALEAFYSPVPALESLTVRSVHLDRRGPTLILRFDLPRFPDAPPPEWAAAGCDTFQCQLRFLAVADVVMRGWSPPVTADVVIEEEENRRIRVGMRGAGAELAFTSSDSLTVGHLSAYARSDDGTDAGPRHFVGRTDQFRWSTVPDVWEKNFYERV
ncbi:Imm50 family immunity protein [Streptomyces sp. H39-S7]|uniref:Imm50 family immunity protein n=1 Tax=Streptomyces sp. H39-S7 TaxID=3004357 RepID=UPI0022AF1B5C|nr:Imm50 family immunity protein [Streptomyces sp. H39-S7]MCZ4122164.1 Imm50 family immunity protein [Streptomyces sp. H39-S7]